LQVCLGLLWLLDAALQYQPFMFGPGFVTRGIEPAAAGNPAAIVSSVTWASHLMLRHIAAYNAMFASIQLLLAIGFFFRRTVKLALAASIVWALSVWWFGESLGGILTGTSPLAGLPGAVVLYALIAIVLWPPRSGTHEPTSAAAAGTIGNSSANFLWLALWGCFAHYLLLPANRAPDAITHIFSAADGQPRWVAATMALFAQAASTEEPRSPSYSLLPAPSWRSAFSADGPGGQCSSSPQASVCCSGSPKGLAVSSPDRELTPTQGRYSSCSQRPTGRRTGRP